MLTRNCQDTPTLKHAHTHVGDDTHTLWNDKDSWIPLFMTLSFFFSFLFGCVVFRFSTDLRDHSLRCRYRRLRRE